MFTAGTSGSQAQWRYRWIVLLCLVCGVVVLCLLVWYPRELQLNGLLLDLELDAPDVSRHGRLREALTQLLPAGTHQLRNYRINVDYAHFMALDSKAMDPARIDFVVLSPQGTPWSQYGGRAEGALVELSRLLERAVYRDVIPVLGICGGHQFLALAFGGSIDFIDPAFAGAKLERYPPEARAERGVVRLQTLQPDPIFHGVAEHPGYFSVLESHYEEVKNLPRGFVNLAQSEMSPIQLMRVPGKVVYGLAFHPERCWKDRECAEEGLPAGRRLLVNFMLMAAAVKSGTGR